MQSANLFGPLKGLCPHKALIGLTQASGLAGGFDYVAFRGFFEDKIAYVPFVFLCRIDILRSTHHGNCALLE